MTMYAISFMQTRTREKLPGMGTCDGDAEETIVCSEQEVHIYVYMIYYYDYEHDDDGDDNYNQETMICM